MQTIHKYPLKTSGIVPILLPSFSSKILSINFLKNQGVCLWVEFDKSELSFKDRYFQVFGTGEEIPKHSIYLDSCIVQGSIQEFVWHIYEIYVEKDE